MKKYIALFCMAVLCSVPFEAYAQDTADMQNKNDYDAFRTKTWSFYLQGGMSWAGGVDMKNVHAVSGTGVSPLVGLGVNYNIKPWVRLGLNYEYSKYKREQRFDEFQPFSSQWTSSDPNLSQAEQWGGLAYRDRWTRYHNVDLTMEFNIMEIWHNRQNKRFNLYAGTGVGGMFGKGNTYEVAMGYDHLSDPTVGSNNHEMHSWVKAHNSRHHFSSVYVPVELSAEYDIEPRFTLGVKGSYKFLCSSKDFAPENLGMVAITARYNILCAKHGYKSNRRKLNEAIAAYDALQSDCLKAQNECNDKQAAAAVAAKAQEERIKALEEENARLKAVEEENARLKANEKRLAVFNVQFRFNSAVLTQKELGRLLRYIETVDESTDFEIVGEADKTGNSTYNQSLSERRAKHIANILKKNGIEENRIKSVTGIGDSSNISDPTARRVTIKIAR